MNDAYIVAYGRSAVTRAKDGGFVGKHPVEWTAKTLLKVLDKVPSLPKEAIDDIILGCARHENKCSRNMARLVALQAGLPYSVSGQTINRFCASGLQAIATASALIRTGCADVIVAGGVEQMSMTLSRLDSDIFEELDQKEPGAYIAMGLTAENVAGKYGISREEQDLFAVKSHKKAAAAKESGQLQKSIVEIDGIAFDEGIRPESSPDALAKLRTCFKENGTVTAATSSQTSDGAAFCVLMSKEACEKYAVRPLAKLIGFATAGCDPEYMGLGPVFAVPKVMKQTGLSVSEMDTIELNEAFAAQAIPCIRELELPEEKVNPWGGAIALGHPMGATGCVLTCKALDYLEETEGRYALVTMCIGGGMGAAGILERLI